MQWLKQSTAVTLKIGPFLDETDGKTAETGLTIAQADVLLSKNGGAFTQKTEATSCTHDAIGWYGCPVDVTDTATLGRLQLAVHEAGALPVWHEFMVVSANTWDSFFAAENLDVNAAEISGDATAADNAEAFFDGTGYAGTNNVIPTVTALTGHTAQTGDNFARIGAPAGASVSADIADVPTVAEMNARTLVSASYFDPAADAVANVTLVATTTTNTDVRGTDSAALASVCTETRLAELDAANLPTDIADVPTVAEFNARTQPTADYFDPAADAVADVTTVGTLTGHTAQTGDSYARLGAPAGASIAADLVAIDNFVDDLETRLSAARAGYLDELAAANLPADIDTLLTRITAAVALASVCTEARLAELDAANLPTDIAALPTTAEVNTEVDTALSDIHLDHLLAVDYDPASKPGVATALFNELIESDGGVSRYTANALEEAPTGGSAPTVEEIRTEIDDNSTQLAVIVEDTGELQTDDVPGLIAALNDIAVTDITQRQIPDSVPAVGTRPTIEQALYMIAQWFLERGVVDTTMTVYKVDGSTPLMTLTLDDGTDPTSYTRAT